MLEHHVDADTLAGDLPDRLAELARLLEPGVVFRRVHLGQLTPAIELLAVDDTLGPLIQNELPLALVADDADGVGPGGVGKLDRVRAEAPRRAPDQHVLPRLQVMRRVAKEHPVGGGERQRVARAFLPCQMFGARHELLRLHAGELRKRAVMRLIAPDALRGREHRIAAIAFLVVAIVLITMDNHLVADLPARDLVAHLPDDPRRIRPGDVIIGPVAVKGADRLAKTGPDAVIIDACRHHQNQHLVAVDLPGIDHLHLEALFRCAVALAADRPSIHLLRHMPQRGHLADLVEVLLGRLVGRDTGLRVQGHHLSPVRECRDAESRRSDDGILSDG